MWDRVEVVFIEAFDRLRAVLAADLPSIVAMLVVILGSVALAFVARAVLRWSLTRVGFDTRAREWGMTTGRGIEPHHEPSWLVARGTFWIVVATGVALAFAVLGASSTSAVGLALLGFLPHLVVGALVLLVGIGAARFLERSVLIGAVNQGIRQARLLALAVKWIVLVLAAAMALQHVGVGGALPTIAFTIVIGGIVLAAALAVGLGARDVVGRTLERHPPGGPRPAPPPDDERDQVHHL
jgi:hypothetical protein